MLKTKILGVLVLLGSLASTSTAVAGSPPFEFPSAYQCIYLTNQGRLSFAVIANTNWDKCREAYSRVNGIEVTITGIVDEKKTWKEHYINTREILRPGRVIRPRLGSVFSTPPARPLSAKDYMLRNTFDVRARWIH